MKSFNPEQYGLDVLSGKIAVSEYVRLSVARHFNDLEKKDFYIVKDKDDVEHRYDWDYYFDIEAGIRILRFFNILVLHEGEFAGRRFVLQPWQAWTLYVAFGWKRKDNDMRRFKYIYIEVPRKNGKSCMMGGVALYHLVKDNENAPWVYFVATTFSQAMEPMNDAIGIAENTPELFKRLVVRKRSIENPANSGNMIATASDSKKKDGLNPSLVVLDEFHAHPDDGMFVKMKTAFGMRQQPTMLIITTAGSHKSGPCFDYRTRGIDVLKGASIQDNLFSIIYSIDEEDDWRTEDSWVKANPSWGIMNKTEFREEAKEAIAFAGAETSFRNLRLNIWTDAPSVWIKDSEWMAGEQFVRTDKELSKLKCYGGMDFAAVKDLTSLVLNFPLPGDKRHIKAWFWIPEIKVREKEDQVDYWVWKEEGFINVIRGDAINHNELALEVMDILSRYNVQGLTYDKYGVGEMTVTTMLDNGFPIDKLHPLKQVTIMFEAPISKIEQDVAYRRINHENNPVLRWNIANTIIYQSKTGARGFDKQKVTNRIDGATALAMSIAEELSSDPVDNGNVFFL